MECSPWALKHKYLIFISPYKQIDPNTIYFAGWACFLTLII